MFILKLKRSNRVVVRFQDLRGKTLKLTAEGNLLSRAIQHEIDHLDGELFIDKASSRLKADLELTKHGFIDGDVAEMEQALALQAPLRAPSRWENRQRFLRSEILKRLRVIVCFGA